MIEKSNHCPISLGQEHRLNILLRLPRIGRTPSDPLFDVVFGPPLSAALTSHRLVLLFWLNSGDGTKREGWALSAVQIETLECL